MLTFTACEKHGLAISVTEDAMAKLSLQVNQLIADKSCDGTSECGSIAWGVDPCDNFRSYLVYNPSQVDVPTLEKLAAQYNQLERELNHLTDAPITTDCEVVLIEPELACEADHCETLGDRYVIFN